jgi:nitroimidazol reductase NimA-like FMN-containing flavoprotein (pyridoxamine 5'-phosphate oxidase superfamily)
MPTEQAIQIPAQVASYLLLHHILTLGTASITGMPHAATTAYASGEVGVYFSMRPDELTVKNVAANHWASFTIDDYTPALPPAGWYTDPAGTARKRYWNGEDWTSHVR